MKKLIPAICCILSFLCTQTKAQIPFNTIDSLVINNINATMGVHGDMWPPDSAHGGGCLFPNGTRKSLGFAASLWMSGYDATSQLHVSAQTYRQTGNDYWPGPLDASDTLTYATSKKWASIWKIAKTQINFFLGLGTHTTSNTPLSILHWPGRGNTYAQGNGGASLSITQDMAPFVDLNGNGIYEPLLGEYPDIKGDEALWCVFSDNGPTHNNTKGKPLGIETHLLAYEYKRGTLIDDVVYYEYTIFNRSSNNYYSFRLAQFADMDLGWYLDDYIGFDSTHSLGITYNATNCDGCDAGNPPMAYGLDPPMAGITMLSCPGGISYDDAGSFTYFNNDSSIVGNPTVDTEFNNYMRSKIRNGEHISDDFAGKGAQSKGYGAGPDINYVFTSDPSNNVGWSECNANNTPGDRRFVLATNDYILNAGASLKFVTALVVADSAGGCPVDSFAGIKTVADTAWAAYCNSLSVQNTPPNPNTISVYPNPTTNTIQIQTPQFQNTTLEMYNLLSQKVITQTLTATTTEIDMSKLCSGIYLLRLTNGTQEIYQTKIVKQ